MCGPVCTDRSVKLYHLAQKRSIRFTKLLLPYTSVHAYSPKQRTIVFLQLQNQNVNGTDWQKGCLLFSPTCEGYFASRPWICQKSITWYSAITGMRFKEQTAIRWRRKNPGHFITLLFLKGRPGIYWLSKPFIFLHGAAPHFQYVTPLVINYICMHPNLGVLWYTFTRKLEVKARYLVYIYYAWVEVKNKYQKTSPSKLTVIV